MNLPVRFSGLTLLAVFALLICCAHSAPLPEEKAKRIPEALKAWEGWVTWGEGHRECSTPYNDAKKHLCFWPSRLDFQVDRNAGHFALGVTVFHETWVPLPGSQELWPLGVKANGAPVPVVEHDRHPSIHLAAGTYQLEGGYQWKEIPQSISLPRGIGVLALTLEGKSVEIPAWDAQGVLWLRRDGASEAAEKDFLSVKVYSVLEDGIPLWLRTEIELTVSGKSREEVIGGVLPEGWKLASVESPIPVSVDETGRMKAQVRAGKWTVRADAFRLDNPKEVRYAQDVKPAVTEQLIAFRSRPELRMVEIVGAPSIDVSQTTFPEQWRELPVYRWSTATPLQIEERMRGMGMQTPEGLTIARELWLDEDGRGLTFRDYISGQMQQIWRLDAAPGQDLGSVRSAGEGQLITRNPQNGAPGVEIRTRTIDLEATGRMDRAKEIPATGWRADADKLDVTLNLPPGWRLFALFGADWVRGDWLTAWTLLDLFLLLIFSLAVFRIWGVGAAILAFVAFGISYHEAGAPRYTWLALLIPLALLRVVPEGWGRRVLLAAKWVVLAVFVLILVPFIAGQVQQALYPQLENVKTYSNVRSAHFGSPAALATSKAAAPQSASQVRAKLDRILLPRVEFHETNVRDALAYLEQQSVELDTEEQDPSRRGVKIDMSAVGDVVLARKIPGLEPQADVPTLNEARVTVSLTNIPLGEAIRYVTGLANLKFRVEPQGVIVAPQGTPTETLLTKELKLTPGLLSNLSNLGDERKDGIQRRAEIRDFLAAQGVAFPPGSSAIYLPSTSKLIVRNTQENLDLIDAIVDASAATPSFGRYSQSEPGARIQTGPGVPEWSWRTVSFGWNGPVNASQQVHPVLISLPLERFLTILRIVLVLALAAVLLNAWKLGGSIFRQGGKAAAVLMFCLWAGGASTAHAQVPDKATLDTLRERLLETSDAYPNAAEIPTASLTLNDRHITIDAEIHAAIRTAVPLPGRLPTWSPLSVLVDDKPEVALRREDGFLWVVVPEGVHRVRVEGLLPNVTEWEWTFQLRPRQVTINAPGWTVSGVRPNGVPEPQVFFALQQRTSAAEASYDRQNLQTVLAVNRTIELGLLWQVRTTVSRLSPGGKAVAFRIPLLSGESVISANALVQNGMIEVRLGANESAFTWESRLQVTDRLKLETRPSDTWAERWHLVASPVWNVTLAGLAPIFETESSELIPVWHPWPGESVELAISRPEALPGATTTVSRGTHEIKLGRRQRVSNLDLSVRSSLGEDFLVDLPTDAEVTSLAHNGKSIPVRRDGTKLIIPLRPGEQSVAVGWKINTPLGFRAAAEEVRLPVKSANIQTVIEVSNDRWVLWAYGPLRGPAVRFWGILICSLLAAWVLGRIRLSPLRPLEWMLLVIGLTQVPLPAALIVIGWLFFLVWRGRESFLQLSGWPFNLLQLILIAVTAIALGILITAVGEGLLGDPEMFIRGNGSSRTELRWYQPRSDVLLPQPGCISVSIWWYRFLMLLWALWLAAALIRWLRWGWEQFGSGGFFRPVHPRVVTPPPIPPKA